MVLDSLQSLPGNRHDPWLLLAGGAPGGDRVRPLEMPQVALSILQRVAGGDQRAVQDCLDRYGNLVWSLALKLLANRSDAEEAVQDVFVDLWSHAARFDPAKAEETTFVAMIARRRLIDRLRKEKRRPPAEDLDVVAEASAAGNETDRIEARDEAARALDLLRTFKPEPRRVLQKAVLEGMTHSEIADELGMPLGTVKTHVRRGLIKIREAMRGAGGPGRRRVSG